MATTSSSFSSLLSKAYSKVYANYTDLASLHSIIDRFTKVTWCEGPESKEKPNSGEAARGRERGGGNQTERESLEEEEEEERAGRAGATRRYLVLAPWRSGLAAPATTCCWDQYLAIIHSRYVSMTGSG